MTRETYKVGDIYEKLLILSVERERPRYYKVKCLRCGKEWVTCSAQIADNMPGCGSCRTKDREAVLKKEYQRKFNGKVYGSLEVVDYTGERDNSRRLLALCKCQKCGSITKIPYVKLTSGQSRECRHCGEKNLEAGRQFAHDLRKGGSGVPDVTRSKINKNSSTGAPGVSQMKSGKYRAYLNFRRKQYHLGTYYTIEDAARARNEAKKYIHGEFLQWYKETYPDLWDMYQKRREKGREKGKNEENHQ